MEPKRQINKQNKKKQTQIQTKFVVTSREREVGRGKIGVGDEMCVKFMSYKAILVSHEAQW